MIASNFNTSELLPSVIELSRKAGAEILKIYQTEFDVKNKEDDSPLTAADLASHKTICTSLAKLTPDVPVLSEESADIPFETRKQWHSYWLVDPLDGTKEFIKRNGEFTVNIALIKDNHPVMGVVYVPVTDICYFASQGQGAYRQEGTSAPEQIHTKDTNPDQFDVAGSRSHGSEQQHNFIKTLGENVNMMAIGSSLKFCLVAEGKVDIYPRFGLTSEWDTAAAHCVVEEAGGQITDTNFQPLLYNSKESILNPHFLVIADKNFDWKPYLKG